jgi:hypothetical protein
MQTSSLKPQASSLKPQASKIKFFIKLLYMAFFMFKVQTNFAQTDFACSTPHFQTNVNSNARIKPNGPLTNFSAKPACKKATVRVKVHIIRRTNLTGGFVNTPSDLETSIINNLNSIFSPNFEFILKDNLGINYINNDLLYELPSLSAAGGDADDNGKFDDLQSYSNSDAIDIYLIGNRSQMGTSGRAADIGSTSFILWDMEGSNFYHYRTLIHEMGHCLGLYHTFHGTACNARYPGSVPEYGDGNPNNGNGLVAGDYVLDTYPDPTTAFEELGYFPTITTDCRETQGGAPLYVQTCNGGASWQDSQGFPWFPLANNFMDYSYYPLSIATCPLRFTNGQFQRMLTAVANDPILNATVKKATGSVNITTVGSLTQCSPLTPITLTASGNSHYYFNWSTGQNNSSSITFTPTVSNTYTVTATSECSITETASVSTQINDNYHFTIVGSNVECAGNTNVPYTIIPASTNPTSLTGTWSILDGNNVTINAASGVLDIASNATGIITIGYTVNIASGCIGIYKKAVTINPITPTVYISSSVTSTAIPPKICAGEEITLTAIASAGVTYEWNTTPIQTTQSITLVPSVGANNYSVTVKSSCNTNTATQTYGIEVKPLPVISAVVPIPSTVCAGTSLIPILYHVDGNAVDSHKWFWSGGALVGSNASVVYNASSNTISVGGNPGIFSYNYQYTDDDIVTPCTNSVTGIIKVNPSNLYITTPTGTSTLEVCETKSAQLTASIPNGVWESLNTAVAVVDQSGKVTGVSFGTTSIRYTSTICGNKTSTINVTVNKALYFTQVTNTICLSNSTTPNTFQFKVNYTTGTWLSSNIAVASVNSSGVVTAHSIGRVTISYSPANSFVTDCISSDPISYTINVIDCSGTPVFCSNTTGTEIRTIATSTVTCGTNTITAGTISNINFSNGLYYITDDLIIEGTVNFENAQVQIARGKTITIADNAVINISKSHFYSCSQMWGGIRALGNNSSVNITGDFISSSLIEDAEVAVWYKPCNRSYTYDGYNFINVNNTIFNRNKISIQIQDVEVIKLPDGSISPFINYPVSIYNCVFTSRRIPFNPNIIAWANVTSLKHTTIAANTANYITPVSYSAPYINNNSFSSNIDEAKLKDGMNANYPTAGIVLEGLGSYPLAAPLLSVDPTTGNNNITYITIGGECSSNWGIFETNTNVFDNLQVGIDAKKSSVYVHNATFQNSVNTANCGIGIKAMLNASNTIGYFGLFTPANSYDNAFYNVKKAVSVKNFKNVLIQNCHISSNHNVTNPTDVGDYGIVVSLLNSPSIKVNNNTITNIKNGIWLSTGAVEPENAILRQPVIEVNNNTIREKFTTLSATNTYLKNAINIDFYNIMGNNNASVKVKNNTIGQNYNTSNGAVNGIKVSGLNGIDISGNNIQLVEDKLTPAVSNQYGILQEPHIVGASSGTILPVENTIEDNIIIGYNATGSIVSTGVCLKQSSNTKVQCNTVSELTHGFRFNANNPNTKFWDNTMSVSNQFGFTLENGGIIGMQGNWNSADGPICPSNNNWEFPATVWQINNHYMTNTIYSLPNQSQLVVLNSINHPELNPNGAGNSLITGQIYNHTGNTTSPIIYASTNDPLCTRCATANTTYARTAEDVTILEQIADGTILLLNDRPEERLQVMQEQLLELLNSNTYLLANSTSLQQFVYNNQWTNLDFIVYGGQLLAEGDMQTLETLLGFWPGQDGLDETYYQYFEWMVAKYYNPEWQPDEQIVLEYANRCPLTHGTIVYAIRNFYNAITGKIHAFENNCEPPAARLGNKPAFIRLKQPQKIPIVNKHENNQLFIYPNPAVSFITIKYPDIKQVIIYDIHGRALKYFTYTKTNMAQLNISGLNKGVYLVKIINANDVVETKKIMVQ